MAMAPDVRPGATGGRDESDAAVGGTVWPAAPAWRQDGGVWQGRGADGWACALGLGLPVHARRLRADWCDQQGNTYLHYWAQAPDSNTAWALAQPDAAFMTANRRGETPWIWLLRRADGTFFDGWRARRAWPRPGDGSWLMETAWRGDAALTVMIGDILNWPSGPADAQGTTPLMVACHRLDAATRTLWLAQAPEVGGVDHQQRGLAHHLAVHGDLDNMLRAEALGADLDARDARGDTAMDILRRYAVEQSEAVRTHWARRWRARLRF